MSAEIWHFEGRKYRLVRPELVSYPRFERRRVDGRIQLVKLPDVSFSVVTAELIGNEKLEGRIHE